jgi:hypothetical protein
MRGSHRQCYLRGGRFFSRHEAIYEENEIAYPPEARFRALARWGIVAVINFVKRLLLCLAEADVFAVQPVLGGTDVPATDHRLSSAKLAARDQSESPATRAGHYGDEGVLRMTQLGLIFKDENRTRVHSFGNPFFQKLQVG